MSGTCCVRWRDAAHVSREDWDGTPSWAVGVVYTGYAMNPMPIRGDWVGKVVDGKFPLIEWLGGSDAGGVFVSEISRPSDSSMPGAQSQQVAIKLIPASAEAQDRLAMWVLGATLNHPHLLRILKSGRADVDDVSVFYVVTELAEEVLSQILPERTLTGDETREMLVPILDALSYLHEQGWVHGHVKPSNIFVVGNEVKLSSDGLLEAGKSTADLATNDIHNAPEAASGAVTAASDMWSLGVTLVEALTQQQPVWDSASNREPEIPGSLPRPFAEIARECLHVDPARRYTVDDVRAEMEEQSEPAGVPTSSTEASPKDVPQQEHRISRTLPSKMPLIPLIIGVVLLVAIVIGLRIHAHKTQSAPLDTEKTMGAPPAEPGPNPSTPAVAPGGAEQGAALNRPEAEASSGALNTIHGKVTVEVRVRVNPTGAVTDAQFASHGPSAYFARVAMEAARQWTFKPPKQNGQAVASTWLLRYEFRRSGQDATAKQMNP